MINTFHQEELLNNSILHLELCDDGQNKKKLDILDQMEQEEYIISTMSEKYLELKTTSRPNTMLSAMQELVPTIKKKISKDKLQFSKQSIQMQKSLKTLEVDSIGIDQDLTPFWNKSTVEISKKLWLPTKIDCVDLDLSLYNGSSKNLMQNSWFSARIQKSKTQLTSSQKIYLQSLQSLLPKITALELDNTEEIVNNLKKKTTKLNKEQAEKAIKIRIFPDSNQKQTLKKWFGVRRWIYNKCLHIMKENYKNKIKTTQKMLRKLVINEINYKHENQWMLDFEYDLRDEAMRDMLKNLTSNIAKGKGFDLKFKSKKEKETLIVLSKKWNKKNNFYSSIFKPKNMKSSEPLPEILEYSSRLIKTETKKYYFCLPAPLVLSENQAPENSMIFIDPGVKTFITGYDPSGKIITWGERDVGRISRLLHYQRKLQSKIRQSKIKKNSWRIANLKIGENIRNLVTELHKKLSKWLCENYENIYLPRLNFHNCKNLNRKSKAKLASLSHCKFLERLKDKTREYSKVNFYEVNEAYTSKTCSDCGYQKENLKNNDTYDCDNCHIKIGRDINASKNIMQRYFTKRALVY